MKLEILEKNPPVHPTQETQREGEINCMVKTQNKSVTYAHPKFPRLIVKGNTQLNFRVIANHSSSN